MKVFIVGLGYAYGHMFKEAGFTVVDNIEDCDLVQFIGGADVNPALYGHGVHPSTSFSELTDATDAQYYEHAKRMGLPMTGICRGGQFLNVSNGGKMVQDTNKHAVSHGHLAYDLESQAAIAVSSTHHQMMIPTAGARIVAIAHEATYKYTVPNSITLDIQSSMKNDVEVLYYEDTKCLCFQPHPEFTGVEQCRDYYFACLKKYLGVSV